MSEESVLRFGGMFNVFPQHINYCKEVWAGLKHLRPPPSSDHGDFAGMSISGGGGAGSTSRSSLGGSTPTQQPSQQTKAQPPMQSTTFSFMSEKRTCDVEMTFAVEEDNLYLDAVFRDLTF